MVLIPHLNSLISNPNKARRNGKDLSHTKILTQSQRNEKVFYKNVFNKFVKRFGKIWPGAST